MKAMLAVFLVSCGATGTAADGIWEMGAVPPNTSATELCKSFTEQQGYVYRGVSAIKRLIPSEEHYQSNCLFRFSFCEEEMCNGEFPMFWSGAYCPTGQVFNDASGLCEKAKPEPVEPPKDPDQLNLSIQKGRINDALSCGAPSRSWGNPVNLGNGNKVQEEQDYIGPGAFPLRFVRTYNSLDGLWRHSYARYLTVKGSQIILVQPDGRGASFALVNGIATAQGAELGKLTQQGSGWLYTSSEQERFSFDSQGRLTAWQNANGLSQQLTYANQRVTVKDPFGYTLSYSEDKVHQPLDLQAGQFTAKYAYDSNGRLVSSQRSDGGETRMRRYAYEDYRLPKALTRLWDDKGMFSAHWRYDEQGRAISSQHAGDAMKVAMTYNADGSVTATNALGKRAKYRFQAIQGIPRITAIEGELSANCAASNSSYTYDARGQILTHKDNKGHITQYAYDSQGRQISRTEAKGSAVQRITQTVWDAASGLPARITQGTVSKTFVYDSQRRLLKTTLSDGKSQRTWSYTYNAMGLLESEDGPRTDLQDITRYAYDAKGNLTRLTNALGHVTEFANHNARGKPQTITNANGVVAKLAYTGVDQHLVSVTGAGSTSTFEYNADGQLSKVVRGDGSSVEYDYDGALRLTSLWNNLDELVEYDYDPMGNRTALSIEDANEAIVHKQKWAYDELGRLLQAVGAAGQSNSYKYDLNDNPVGQTNPRRYSSTQTFDELDRPVTHTDALKGVTRQSYNAQNNLTEVKDPRGLSTRYEYDGLGNLTKRVSPDSGTTTFAYDAAGNLTKQTDARGVVVEFTYDALNRLSERRYPATPTLNQRHLYDSKANGNFGVGRLTAIEDSSGSLAYRYDARGNLIEQARSLTVNNQTLTETLTYQYDAGNNLIGIGYPGKVQVGYSRNVGGQVAQVTLAINGGARSNLASQISYQPFGPLKQLTWANGIQLKRTYDLDYQLTRQDVGPWRSNYKHDANGNITELANNLWGTLTYSYDALDRLTAEQGTAVQRRYSYDAVGNRLEKRVTENASTTTASHQYATTSNRLSAVNGQATAVDAVGNLNRDRASRLLGYDAQNRLAYVQINGQVAAQYRYNSLGQRVTKITSQGFTTYLYGLNGTLLGESEYNATGALQRTQSYLWLDSLPLASVNVRGTGAAQLLYLHSDHLDTPRLATSAKQQIVWQWQSDAFGEGKPNQDPQGSGQQTVLNLRFPGQYYDIESGLHYNYFRDYDPQTGRYVENDPIGLEGGLNTYGYVLGNPLKYSDPKGLSPLALCFVPGVGWATCGAAVEAAIAACATVAVRVGGFLVGGYLASEASPDISPSDVAGKTPEEIDQLAKDKGLNPQGPNPMSGKGSYTDPVTGKQRVLCHTNCDSPHAHVNNPQGERLDVNGNVVAPESPAAHLPINY
jgi:RHS repeat-associated protein